MIPNPETVERGGGWSWCRLCKCSLRTPNVFRHITSKKHERIRKDLNRKMSTPLPAAAKKRK